MRDNTIATRNYGLIKRKDYHLKRFKNNMPQTHSKVAVTALYNVIICRALREAIIHILITFLYFRHYYIVKM
jgi:hypothetical protein